MTACSSLRDHRIAEILQRVLQRAAPQEALCGLSVEALYEAVLDEATVGGDSCDAFALDGGRVALAVADASGKGLAAAERVAEVRFALRAFLREHSDPGWALARLNDFVCDAQRLGRHDDSTFSTLTLVVLDCSSHKSSDKSSDKSSCEMLCLCAGGEPPLVLRAGGTVEVIQVCGPALGLFPRQEYAAVRMSLGAGDTVLLATDGLTEARRSGMFLGLEGLAHLAVQAQSRAETLSQIVRAIFEGARAFAGGSFHDDACLLIGQRQA